MLNLELGIDTCYFSGMDTYIKTWLQLAFPTYVILLVVLVIIISSYSAKFSNLIGKKDPVATLATLILKWSRNPKIQTFIETYHKPYTPKHRYWTGLLLIVRVVLYLVAATNVSNDPTIALTALNFTVYCIFALKQFFGSRLYRKWSVDVLETFFYLNILFFIIFTWYSLDSPASNQKAAAYTSVTTTFIALLLIILYHVYTYTSVFSKIQETKFSGMIDRLFTDADPKPKPKRHSDWSPPPDDDIHRFYELLDVIDRPVNTHDYEVPVKQQEPVKPTQSVMEVHQPRNLAAPDPEEVANSLHIPGAAEAAQIKA